MKPSESAWGMCQLFDKGGLPLRLKQLFLAANLNQGGDSNSSSSGEARTTTNCAKRRAKGLEHRPRKKATRIELVIEITGPADWPGYYRCEAAYSLHAPGVQRATAVANAQDTPFGDDRRNSVLFRKSVCQNQSHSVLDFIALLSPVCFVVQNYITTNLAL